MRAFFGIVGCVLGGIVLMLTAPDPFGLDFDFGVSMVVAGLFAGLLIPALRLRHSPRRWRRWLAGCWLLAVALLGTAAAVAIVDYRRMAFRRAGTDAWRDDLQALRAELERLPAGLRERALRTAVPEVAAIEGAVGSLSEGRRLVLVAKAIAALGDGHSVAFPFFPATDFTLTPLQIEPFVDGWFVTAAGRPHSALRGARVVRLAGLPIDDAFAAMRPYVSADNDHSARVRAGLYMVSPGLWHALDRTGSDDWLDIEVQASSGSRVERIEAVSRVKYLWWYLQPLSLWEQRRPWTLTTLAERRAVVLRLRAIRPDGSRSLTSAAAEALAAARGAQADRVVIDLRGNGGGDNTTFRGLVTALAGSEFNARGRLFVLIDSHTFSAATNLVTALERRTSAILVGAATGSGPNHFGDANLVILPRTRTALFLSTRYHQFGEPDDPRTAHMPHVPVPRLSADYFAGRDATLEAALNWSATVK